MKAAVTAAMSIGIGVVLAAQTGPQFEVTSVKPNKDVSGQARVEMAGGRFTAIRVTLQELARMAYPIQDRVRNDEQLVGGPSWIRTERFDVVATGGAVSIDTRRTPGAVSPPESAELDQVRLMLQRLLADRFKLTVHHESRQLPVYALTVQRSDGRLGAQLRKLQGDCAAPGAGQVGPDMAACGGFKLLGPGRLTAHAVTIPMLVSLLANLPAVGRIVEDRTGLNGAFDLDLTWTSAPSASSGAATTDPLGPSIFTAVQEQLGLKLEAARGPVDVVVIDHAEQPTPD